MKILPVIDLLGGVVVRGVAGNRIGYRPIQSVLAPEPTPAAVARGLVEQFGFQDVYIADLDAIGGAEPAWGDYEAVAAAGLALWVDAGIDSPRRAADLAQGTPPNGSLGRIIVGLESLIGRSALTEIVAAVGTERLVFSLDLKHGQPLTASSDFAPLSPREIACAAHAAGLRRVIVLDLARVGVGGGTGTESLIRQIQLDLPDVELIGGGGIRDREGLSRLAQCGLSRILVASALHDGRIRRKDLEAMD